MRILISLLLTLLSCNASAKDSLDSVMARMKPTQAISITYQETRTLGLLSDTWKGSGSFYAVLPDIMLKEQLTPEKEIMGIKGAQLYYYHPGNDQKHQSELEDEDAVSFQVAAFKGLMNGDLAFLKTRYALEFTTTASGWSLTLTPKQTNDSETATKMIMRGLPEQVANKLELLLADGDRTEYRLTPALQGAAVKTKVQQLLTVLEAR
ncbi:MAG: outer membrane lipoprotein carrier protein LolA [Methylococcaceae bacterium]|nr:outer membrane lipoprotein carrier protein LolA [Methylococcaceae bacterium]